MDSFEQEASRSEKQDTQYEIGINMQWYVLRVAANKEMQVKEALTQKVNQEGLTDIVGRIEVPVEQVRRIRGSKQTVHKQGIVALNIDWQQELNP